MLLIEERVVPKTKPATVGIIISERIGVSVKKVLYILILLAVLLSACVSDADVASQNISTAADQFQIVRRIVFYDGVNGEVIFVVEGLCSLGNYDTVDYVSVTCKVGESEYVKHYLGLSDNVTYFAEQLKTKDVSVGRYKVIIKPSALLPDFDLE